MLWCSSGILAAPCAPTLLTDWPAFSHSSRLPMSTSSPYRWEAWKRGESGSASGTGQVREPAGRRACAGRILAVYCGARG